MKILKTILIVTTWMLTSFISVAQQSGNNVKVIGEMRKVMWEGQLNGNIILDTISDKEHLYGLGPVEFLKGELLIVDGKSYRATINNDSNIKVEETYLSKAPFFGYANIDKWRVQDLPDSIKTMKDLENYLDKSTKSTSRPFMFKIIGTVEHADIHVVNLPPETEVNSPDVVHRNQSYFSIKNQDSQIIGFFSTEHKTIFTHHDTYLHMHLITSDVKKMGHVDDVNFRKGNLKLYLPEQ